MNYMYIASWTGADNPMGSIHASNKAFTTLVICCKFQKNCFELLFFMDFFYEFIHAGQRQITPMG